MITERDRAKTLALSQPVPAARTEGLVTTLTDDEILVYDQERHHVHHLNRTAAVVWKKCDGRRGILELQHSASAELGLPVDPQSVRLAVAKLADANLLVTPLSESMRLPSHSRRAFVRRAAVASAIAVPVVVSMTAPALAASKACGSQCNPVGGGVGKNGNCPGMGLGFQCNHCWINGIVTDTNGTGNCNQVDSSDPCYCGCPPTQLVGGLCPSPSSPPPPPAAPKAMTVQSQSLAPQSQMAPTDAPTPEPTNTPVPQDTQPPAPQDSQAPVDQQSTDQSQGDGAPADVPSPTPTDTPPPPPPPAALVNNAPVNNAPIGGNPANLPSTFVANPNGDGNGNSGNGGD